MTTHSPPVLQGGWPSNHRGDFPLWVWVVAGIYPFIIGWSGLTHGTYIQQHTTLWQAIDIQNGTGEPVLGALLWVASFCILLGYLADSPFMAWCGCLLGGVVLAGLSAGWVVWSMMGSNAGFIGVAGMVEAAVLLLGLSPSAWRRRVEKEAANLAPRRLD